MTLPHTAGQRTRTTDFISDIKINADIPDFHGHDPE